MTTTAPPKPSRTAEAMQRARVERTRALTPEQRVLLALELGSRARMLAAAKKQNEL